MHRRFLGLMGSQRLTCGRCHVLVHTEQQLPGSRLHVAIHVVSEDGRSFDEEGQRRWGQTHHLQKSRDIAAAPHNFILHRETIN